MSTLPDTASDALFARVAAILEQARARAVRAVHNEMVLAYWHIGREIVTYLQQGATRAGYGDALLTGLSARLTRRFGKRYSETNLKYFRQFYIVYADRTPEIRHGPRDESAPLLPGPAGEPDAVLPTAAFRGELQPNQTSAVRPSEHGADAHLGEFRGRTAQTCYDFTENSTTAHMTSDASPHPAPRRLVHRSRHLFVGAEVPHRRSGGHALRLGASRPLDAMRPHELRRVRMIIAFRTRALRDLSQIEARADRAFGTLIATKLRQRLAELRAAETIADLIVGNPTALPGDGPPRMSLDLGEGQKVIFCPNHPASKWRGSPEQPWSAVRRVKILQIGGTL